MDKFLCLSVIVLCVTKTTSSDVEEPVVSRNTLPADENQFPYMISLQKLSEIHSPNRGHTCGGALVTLQHVVTAGSCIRVFNPGTPPFLPIDRDEYIVFAGSASLSNHGSADRIRRIANTVAHPQYTDVWNAYNIGVIVLGTPFSSNTVNRLPVRDIDTAENVFPCTSMGWRSGTQLLHAPMRALSDSTCRVHSIVVPNIMCAMPEPISYGCPGDMGSPLVCSNGLVGVFVESNGCPIPPQQYIRVSQFTTWINTVVDLPIPELGPEPTTVPPPPTVPTTTTPAPGAAAMFQPGMTLFAVIAIAQIITARG